MSETFSFRGATYPGTLEGAKARYDNYKQSNAHPLVFDVWLNLPDIPEVEPETFSEGETDYSKQKSKILYEKYKEYLEAVRVLNNTGLQIIVPFGRESFDSLYSHFHLHV